MKKSLVESMKAGKFDPCLSNLYSMAYETYKKGHYIESALINFQLVEIQLRLITHIFAKRIGLTDSTYKKIVEKEDRFFLLINYLDLLKPDNGLSDRLRKLNKERNDFVHGLLFTHQSLVTLNKSLKKFCDESVNLISDLFKLVVENPEKERVN